MGAQASVCCTDTAYLFKFELEIATYEAHTGILGSSVECSISPKNIVCLMLVKHVSHPAIHSIACPSLFLDWCII
jgi:hypothetical protein